MSRGARNIRIACELEETVQRLAKHGVENTVLFFASARSKSHKQHDAAVEKATAEVAAASDSQAKLKAETALERLQKGRWVCDYYEKVQELARLIAEWGLARTKEGKPEYSINTGGGPGMMCAANAGAAQVEGAKSIGMGISLPFEKGLNPCVTPELAFEFHYFFTRKFFMVESAKALVVAPGGLGTCDELFEVMTLMQTGKHGDMPIVLFGKEYWKNVINWQYMADHGTISQADADRLFFTDSEQEAFAYIKAEVEKNEAAVQK